MQSAASRSWLIHFMTCSSVYRNGRVYTDRGRYTFRCKSGFPWLAPRPSRAFAEEETRKVTHEPILHDVRFSAPRAGARARRGVCIIAPRAFLADLYLRRNIKVSRMTLDSVTPSRGKKLQFPPAPLCISL